MDPYYRSIKKIIKDLPNYGLLCIIVFSVLK